MLQDFQVTKKKLSLFTTNMYSSIVEIGEKDQPGSSIKLVLKKKLKVNLKRL